MRRLLDRLPLRLREIVAVVVALSLGYLVSSHLPVLERDQEPFVRSASAGSTAHLSYADVRVLDVQTAKYLVPAVSSDPVVLASGVFVVTLVEVTATREPTIFASTWLEDADGRKYRPSTRSGCISSPTSDTGIPTYAMLCFEVPTQHLREYRLQVARGSDENADTRQDDVADLALGIDPHAATTRPDPDGALQVTLPSTKAFELETATFDGAP